MQNSTIEWTDHTFSPWHGCVKVSPGCQNCYALALDRRFGRAVWGPAKTTLRMEMSANYWKQPIRWNDAARKAGKRARVFCASMADVFEDHPGVIQWREWLLTLILNTAWLDWQLLTKRPENILRFTPLEWRNGFPPNIWVGTSCEDQRRADERIPHLLNVPAKVRFLSCEPLLEPVNITRYLYPRFAADDPRYQPRRDGIEWVIAGGESGPGARPATLDWFHSLHNQCADAGIPFFMKQMGSAWAKDYSYAGRTVASWGDTKGHDMQYWPSNLRVRAFPRGVGD